MVTGTTARATVEDLARVEGKAELVGGRVVRLMPTGFRPNRVAARVFQALDKYAESTGRGFAFTDGMGFTVRELTSGRESFSPDASYFDGPPPDNPSRFIEGPPTFAVEVRSEQDRGPAAEREMAAKRADYFAAGTLVVWDVDPEAKVVRVHRASEPDQPTVYSRGQQAEAEPALPGWLVAVDALFNAP